jgi:hypothetical protein
MLDVNSEQLIGPNQVPAHAPKIDGKKVALRTVWRWMLSGRLESVKIGSRRATSVEAIQRMLARENPGAVAEVSPSQRKREIRSAEKRLAAVGI